jgi:hypothetical protein
MNTSTPWLTDRNFHAAINRKPVELTETQRERHRLLEEYKSGYITAAELAAAIKQLR